VVLETDLSMDELTLLGRSETRLPETPDRAILEVFPNPSPESRIVIRLETREFTSVCPKTGQPDFATIQVEYIPDQNCIETKSLKFYWASFRNYQAFNEQVVHRMHQDLVAVCKPRKMVMVGEFGSRGGIQLTVRAAYPDDQFEFPIRTA